jgi:hypothetical protein
MKMAEMAVAILGGIGNLVGIRAGTEEPRFTVVERVGEIEIRRYGPRLAAEVQVGGPEEEARNAGFRKVAGYIFGGNTTKTSIAMTAPVAQGASGSQAIAMTAPVAQVRGDGAAWRIQFFMPAKYTLETLPAPNDPAVHIVQVPAQDYAVLRFTGSRSPPAVAAKTQALTSGLAGARWRIVGEPSAWFYDPPWTAPFLRRNEVAAPVTAVR